MIDCWFPNQINELFHDLYDFSNRTLYVVCSSTEGIGEGEYVHSCPTQQFGQGTMSDSKWNSNFESTENQPDTLVALGRSPVNCCNDNGDCLRTQSDGECFPYNATYAEAGEICNSYGM